MPNGKPGFGNSPSSRTIKVTIVGHASPRWRGATGTDADRRNYQLSVQRAEATKIPVTADLRKGLGTNVPIQFDVTLAPDVQGGGVQVGSYGVGSNLTEAGGNRTDNTEYERRVEVSVEMVTSSGQLVQQSLPPIRNPALTKFWYVSIKEIHVGAIGGAFGEIVLILRNSVSNKKMLARAKIIGGGINSTLVSGKKGAQWTTVGGDIASQLLSHYPETLFSVNREIGFSDFNGALIRVEKVQGRLIFGAQVIYMTLLGFGDGAKNVSLYRKFGWGLPKLEGWVASGKLHPFSSVPADYLEEDQEKSTMVFTDRKHSETLILTFATGSSALSASERNRLSEFIATWSRRMGGLST